MKTAASIFLFQFSIERIFCLDICFLDVKLHIVQSDITEARIYLNI